jgi:transposase InsO family protein
MASANPSSPLLLLNNMSNLMSTKLDSSNYMIWKLQITAVLDAYSMLDHLDGSVPKPSQFLTTETGIQSVNPDFLIWNKKDKALLTLLYSTCSSSVLAMVVGKSSSQEVWNTLEERFTSTARSNVLNLKLELQSIKKAGNETVSSYLQRIKTVRDKLSAVGVHSDHEELTHVILKGLPKEFAPFASAIRTRDTILSLEKLTVLLQTEEQSMNEATESLSNSALAMFVSHNKPNFNGNQGFNRGRGRNSYSRGRGGGGRNSSFHQGFSSPNASTQYHPQYQQQQINSSAPQGSQTTFQGKSERPTCQICWKIGHYAIDCYHRMNFAYQGKNPTTKLAAMASASNLHYTQNTETWLTDTGATDHITANANNLSPQAPYQGQEQVSVGNGQNLPIQNIGNSQLHTKYYQFQLKNVLHVPRIASNLLSVHKLCLDNNCSCYFDAKKFSIQDLPTGRILYKGLSNNGVYPIQSPMFIPAANKTACAAHSISSDKWHLWHSRLGHPSDKVLANVFPCFSPNSSSKDVKVHCHHCLAGKMHQLPFPTSNKTITSPFELVHADLWGPAPVVASNSFRFYLVFVDEFTKFTWVYLLKYKSDTFQVFTQFRSMIDTQFSLPIKILRTDCGGEFLSTPFTQFCLSKGILHHLSCPHTPQQNGAAERKHRHLVQCALALLSQSKLPMSYWSYAISTAAHLINKLPTPNLGNQSPWETLYHVSPDLTHLKTFGCECFPLLTPYTSHKLFPKTTPCVFIGYPLNTKGYYCLNPTTNRIYTSRHVLFNETVFPSLKHSNTNSADSAASANSASADSWLQFLLLQHTCSHNTVVISPSTHESSAIPSGQCPNLTVSAPDLAAPCINPTEPNAVSVTDLTDFTASSTNPTEPNVPSLSTMPLPTGFTDNPAPTPAAHASPLPANTVPNTIPDNTTSTDIPIPTVVSHPMQTRSKSGIYKPKLTYAAIIDYAVTEPTSYTVASKHSSWCTAMDEEFQALQKQDTWSLVPLPSSKNVVGCKWVYKLKTHSDGTIARYKARLVAKGFHQQHGIDFNETFSPVIKPPTVRLVLSLAVSLNWPLRQLDVKNAFLHGTLNEEVYMTQPQGYIDPIHPHYVCKLQKSIYGLKQAPRAWFESFTTQLFHLGFIASNADSSLFIYTENKIIAYLLLYVDDIVLTSNTPTFLDTLIHKLSSVFDLKDLGSLHYFLGLQITRTPSRLYINQAKYAQDLLKKHNMLDCKPASSPSCPNTRLSLHDGDPLPDPHAYRSMVGALHYLTFTRPDISFAVHQVCQYMSTPTTIHLAAAKRILRYIRGSFNHGIEFTPGPLSLSGYTDADWAGDPDDRRSTSGFLVYLGHNAITWSAKKQATVSRSSTESEYRALAIASAELCWVRSLLKDLGIYLSDPPILWCDNVSALAIASNPVFHARTKHIEVDFHFVRERVLRKDLVVKFVSTVDQLADIFTKSLSTHRFLELRRNLTVPVP